jgi:AcrR family transcriptional regulator
LLLLGIFGRVRGGPPLSLIGSLATIRLRCHSVSSLLLCDIVVVMGQDPIPVRERTRRAVRGELAQLAVSLFVEKGYDETTIDDLAAAAGMSKRTFFRYFASKEELVMGKYEFFGQQLAEDLAARPADEPLWVSLRQIFGRVADHVENDARRAESVAMEKIVRDHPTLNASYLERVSRMQELVLDEVRTRTGRSDPADPRTAAIVGAAFSCLIAAWSTWLTTNQAKPFGVLLDQALGAIRPT